MLKIKWVAVTLLVSIFANDIKACDLCSVYLGINPNDSKNSFGIMHRYRAFESIKTTTIPSFNNLARVSHLGTGATETSYQNNVVEETYEAFDLWVKIFLNERLNLNFSASFSDNYSILNDSIVNNVSGFGDVMVISKYRLINTKQLQDSIGFVQRLSVGGGIKLPSGNFNKTGSDANLDIDPHLQPGTGSIDYLFLIEYLFKYQKFGINSNVIYKINSKNKNDFRFANRFNMNASLFHLNQIGNFKIMPSIGVAFESGERDQYKGEKFLGSGGEVTFVTTGLTLFYKSVSLGTTYFSKPVHEELYDRPLQVNNKNRIVSELTYYF